jgi:uncharacterized protein (TIGR03000 family)
VVPHKPAVSPSLTAVPVSPAFGPSRHGQRAHTFLGVIVTDVYPAFLKSKLYGPPPPPDRTATAPAPPKPPMQLLSSAPERGRVEVLLPDPDADVWFNGQKTTTPGAQRRYTTPPLEPGREYAYTVRASWLQGGKAMVVERQVRVTAGLTAVVDFTRPEGAGK